LVETLKADCLAEGAQGDAEEASTLGAIARGGGEARSAGGGVGRLGSGSDQISVCLFVAVPGDFFATRLGVQVVPGLGEELEGGLHGAVAGEEEVGSVLGGEVALDGADMAGDVVALEVELAGDGAVRLALAVEAPDAVGQWQGVGRGGGKRQGSGGHEWLLPGSGAMTGRRRLWRPARP
jgi:hypothetical protein